MNRVLLKEKDVQEIFRWRDEHKEEVRSNPMPVRDLEIVCEDSEVRVKCIRETTTLKMWVNVKGKSMGHAEFSITQEGFWKKEKDRLQLDPDGVQSCLSLYGSVVALMVFGRLTNTSNARRKTQNERNRSNSKKRQVGGYTYILRPWGDSVCIGGYGFHSSPKGVFNVRGHYRHYKSGKVVWISEYKKGEGRQTRKKYKLREKEQLS